MCAAVGHPVSRLVRTRIGPLRDQHLAPGEWAPTVEAELLSLQRGVSAAPRWLVSFATTLM